MLAKRIITPILALLFMLVSCTTNNPAVPRNTTSTGIYPTQPNEITPTHVPTEVDPFATYENSFETIKDLTDSGITSNKNGLSTGSKSAIRVNRDIVHSGSQSVEVFGTLGSPVGSMMGIDFPIRSLIGKNTMDLSNKILHVSVFIPKGSPIDKVYFAFSNAGQFAIIPVLVAGDADVKGRWYSDDINLARFFENQSAVAFGQRRNGAKAILWGCDTISLVGQRSTQGGTPSASFIVDDLKWSDVSYTLDSIPVDKSADSLRKYADLHNLKIGSLLLASGGTDYMMDPHYVQSLAQEFNLVCGINTQWPESKPADPENFYLDYTHSDEIFKLLAGAQLAQKGATGGWNIQLPKWLLDEDTNNLQPYLESRVGRDVSRYKGNIFIWDVFNETVADAGAGFRNRQHKGPSVGDFAPYGYLYSPWVDGSDTSLIRAAFIKAHQMDPNAKLFLNDFDNDQIGQSKAETFYRLVADMKKAGVPIDGVGFQMRVWINGETVGTWTQRQKIDLYLANIDKSVKRYAELGLLVEFSEVEVGIRVDDIDLSTPAGKSVYEHRLANQAKVYGGLTKIAVENKNVAAFIIWMVSDRYQQGAVAPGYGDTSLLDAEYQPKPAYYAVLDELKK